MFIKTIQVGVFQCNCTIIGCQATRKAVVVDPGEDPSRILEIIRANNLDLGLAIHTHAHLDHIMGTWEVIEGTGARARLHAQDRHLWDSADAVAATYGIPGLKKPILAEPLEDHETICFGNGRLEVIHTPGHTAGSCCFALEVPGGRKLLFSGDTLFRGKIGIGFSSSTRQTNHKTIIASIRERLLTLDDETEVVPGHGPETRIGIERRDNPFLSGTDLDYRGCG
jgi:glyoxylase-like metal-dependent hydrolase (beta-lactamase superfamily II)